LTCAQWKLQEGAKGSWPLSLGLAVATPGTFTWGYSPEILGDGSHPTESSGEAPTRDLAELKQFVDIVYRLLIAATVEIRNCGIN